MRLLHVDLRNMCVALNHVKGAITQQRLRREHLAALLPYYATDYFWIVSLMSVGSACWATEPRLVR